MFDELKLPSCSRMRSKGPPNNHSTFKYISPPRRLELDHEKYIIKFPSPCHCPLEANHNFDGFYFSSSSGKNGKKNK